MSVITPDASTRNSSHTSSATPTFNRPIPPAPNAERDGEMLNYYFDSTWTTKDIANHFKLSVAVVAAWFQRPDIAALIDFITAANERRARDITRENLPGTIDILLRISRQGNDDKTSRAASSALITFARGRANPKTAATHASTASARSRSAASSPPRGTRTSDAPSPQHAPTGDRPEQHIDDDTRAEIEIAHAPGRSPDLPRSMPPAPARAASDELHPDDPSRQPLHSSPPHSVAC